MKNLTLRSAICALSFLAGSTLALDINSNDTASSMWKVSKGEDSIYVGGTIHILPISEFPLPPQFTQAYQLSDTVVFEAELPDPADAAAQQKFLAAMAYQDGRTLKDTLSEKTYSDLDAYLTPFGANIEQVAGFKPGFIVSMMTMLEAQRVSMAGEGVDSYFTQLAKRDNKNREYFETIEFQMHMLSNLGEGEEDRLISENLSMMPTLKPYLQDIIKAWREGDSEELNELVVDKVKRESPASVEQLLIQRNKNWIPQIEQMFGDDDKELVLVGVGHLVGEENVLALLEQRGYSIEKL